MELETSSKNLDAIQNMALQIYGRYDLDKSLIWFVEEVGEVIAAVRKKKDITDIEGELGDVFAWLLCLSNILDIKLVNALDGTMKKEVSRQMKTYGHLKYCQTGKEISNNEFLTNEETLVIFDCDGVLVDSEYIIASVEAEVFTNLGYELSPEEDIRRFSGKSQKSTIATVEAELGKTLPDDFSDKLEQAVAEALNTKLRPIAHIQTVLSKIPRKCVASSSTYPMIKNSLQVTELIEHFSDSEIFSTAMVKHGKPAPDIFILAAKSMGYEISNCVVIEDSIAGVTAAKAAGIKVLGFTGGSHIFDKNHSKNLINAGACTVSDDIRELLKYINNPKEKF